VSLGEIAIAQQLLDRVLEALDLKNPGAGDFAAGTNDMARPSS
jgi:hypothetical protein